MIRWALAAAITLGFLVCGYFVSWDWDKAIVGLHNFRQTQTAIVAYWMLKEGITFDYQMPVLGKPWVLPLEAPFYQILVVWLKELLSIDLDRAGRIVSVAFWVACLYPLHGILRWIVTDPLLRWATLLLVWSSPTYLYWSDSFLMESTALFFSLVYIFGLSQSIRLSSNVWLVMATLCGVIAGLQKATTFLIAALPAVGFLVLELYRHRTNGWFLKNVAWLVLAGAIPLAALEMWTAHADSLKELNPFGRLMLTSGALGANNFGTFDQRFSFEVWQRIMNIETYWSLGCGWPWFFGAAMLVIFVAIWRGRHRMEIIIISSGWLAATLVFTNLFYIHEYYHFECSLYLQLAFAISVIDLVELIPGKFLTREKLKELLVEKSALVRTCICCAIFLGISAKGIYNYSAHYCDVTSTLPTSDEVRRDALPLTNAGNPQDVLLVYGWDWNPVLAYYTGRKAIVDKFPLSLDDPIMKESLGNLSPDQHIVAMFVTDSLNANASFINERVQRLHLNPTPVPLFGGQYYLRAP
jgi:hypothetical protein